MVRSAHQGMSLAEFLSWEDGTDTRYELVRGEVVAMAPPSGAHSLIAANIVGILRSQLKPPCRAFVEAGVFLSEEDRSYYQADIAVSCKSVTAEAPGVPEPRVIVEILSRSTLTADKLEKLPTYRSLPSVQEILLVSTTRQRVEVNRRTEVGWVVEDVIGAEAAIRLRSVDATISLVEAYDGIDFEKPES